ncbi:tRNA (guanine-N(7)-)-methyltransferase non-catalytic subunit trm82 [Marasmius sp. AFHP31]|nr:tRNA (guanine-N(7)-)-methyltransferase non-catalytic subunit trm82 [Marasmius sp. AFHP31]
MSESHFPHSLLLFSDSGKALVASGQHIQLVDTRTGDILSSTLNASDELKTSLLKSGPIRFIAVDKSWTHLLTFSDDKTLKVWRVEGLELLHERELPKRPTSAAFTKDGQTIVVADKFGDVFSYPLHPAPPVEEPTQPQEEEKEESQPAEVIVTEPEQKPTTKGKRKRKPKNPNHHENPPHARDSVESHTNTSGGTLVLGHTSLLTAFLFSQDEKYIITTDRDEHVRVSWYPQGYVIESFCLGCSRFVSCLHIPKSQPSVLVSGGGDPEIKVWDWHSGQLKHNIPVFDHVKEYIQVKAQPYVRKRGRGKNVAGEDDPMNGEKEATEEVETAPAHSETGTPTVEESSLQEETIFVVNKIETVEREGKLTIVFSIVGYDFPPTECHFFDLPRLASATALFATPFPDSSDSSNPPTIHTLDFGHPVLDFTLDADGLVWVTIDRNLTKGSVSWDGKTIPDTSSSSSMETPVTVVEVKSDGGLTGLTPDSKLLNVLNTACLVPSSPDDLSKLNLYSSLTSLPKNNRGEEDGGDENGDEGEHKQGQKKQKQKQQQSRRDLGPGRGKKEEGKMKSKMAVLEKKKQVQGGGSGTATPAEPEDNERETKRPRSDGGDADASTAEDVTMNEA